MAKIKMDPAQMEAAATSLRTASEDYTRIYGRLMNAANTMGSAWDSADNVAFVNQINGCTEALKAMADKLALTAQVITKMKDNYIAVQDNNKTQVRKLAN